MKRLSLNFLLALAFITLSYFLFSLNFSVNPSAYASSGGSPGGKTNSPGDAANCTQCHSGSLNPGTATAIINSTGLTNGYVPGQTYTLNAAISGTSSSKIGFEITAEDLGSNKVGTLVITDGSRTKLVNGNNAVTHNGAAGTTASSGTNAWTFDWTAPSAGTGDVTFYGAFNVTNSNFGTSGDQIYTSTFTVSESLSTSLEENEAIQFSVYPNPVDNRLFIKSASEDIKDISLRDVQGKLIYSQKQNTKLSSIDVASIPSGIYFVEVVQGETVYTEKILKK